jgi:UDP:flavonoid glycosyltransferase YjiC (YdhE family)
VHVTGYYFFSQITSHPLQKDLESFLHLGKPPVCISFGSMINQDAERIDRIVQKALKQTGNRGVILSGWSGVKGSSSKDLLYLESAPHGWLLPHCKMLIHHGGAGTTAAGLRAGIPNIIVPYMADQPFWGKRVHAVGAGPRPILVKDLSVEKLSQAIVDAEKESLRKGAQIVGQQISNEDGTGEAVKWIEKYSNDFHREY